MNEKARELSEEFLPCADQKSIEENLMRVQDRYGWEEKVTKEVLFAEDTAKFEGRISDEPSDKAMLEVRIIDLSYGRNVIVCIGNERFESKVAPPDSDGTMSVALGGIFDKITQHVTSEVAYISLLEEPSEVVSYDVKIYTVEEETIIHRPAAKYQNAVVITKTSTAYSCTHAYADFLSLAAAGIPVIVDDQANKKIQTATSIICSATDSIQIKTADLDITFKSDDSIITTPTQTENESQT